MQIKKTAYLLLTFFIPSFVLASGFVLKGNVEGLQTGAVSLAYINEAGEDTTLTTHIIGGAFTFTGAVAEPHLVILTITEGWAYNTRLFLENGNVTIHLVKDAPEKTLITGSASNQVYEQLKPGLNDFFEHARQNEAAFHQGNSDSLFAVQQKQWIQSISQTIKARADNYAALYFIQWLLYKPVNYDAILSAFMQLSPAVRNGLEGKKFSIDFEHLHKTSTGQMAPEINGKDTTGQAITLAAFKGKVVLLDFWSSYCGPCRQENKRMLPIYEKYHATGFEVVSFSLDNERKLWLNAIKADGMPWPQASDLRGGAGATAGIYSITDLPRNVLIDRTGKIYGKDLHGDELTKAVEGLLRVGK